MRRSVGTLSAFLCLAAMQAAGAVNEQLLVSTEWLQQEMDAHRVTVVEIGDLPSYESGHIAGARFLALHQLVVARDSVPNELPDARGLEKTLRAAGIPDRGRIVLYARDVIDAARAFFTFDYLGAGDRVALLDGGFAKWTIENRPIEEGPPPAVPLSAFAALTHPEALVRLTAMRSVVAAAGFDPKSAVLIDARSPAQFLGAEAGADIICPGHIPNAVNVPWNENLRNGTFKPPEELEAIYLRAGIDDDATVVAYCRTGMQASVTYFVLRYLGHDVHLYDGSYFEWSRVEYGV